MPVLTETKEPDENRINEMFALYKDICASSFSDKKKRMLISTILGYEDWAWRVEGISKEALIRCKVNDYKRPKGLVRDHHVCDRKETYNRLIEENLSQDKWWKYFWERDKTRILTNEEHVNKNTSYPEIIEIDWTEGYFQSRGYAGFNFRKSVEGEFVKQLCKEYKI